MPGLWRFKAKNTTTERNEFCAQIGRGNYGKATQNTDPPFHGDQNMSGYQIKKPLQPLYIRKTDNKFRIYIKHEYLHDVLTLYF
jgi:hypothetical protein